MSDLHTRIAAAIERSLADQLPSNLPDRYGEWIDNGTLADAVIEALDLAEPCSTAGCRMRKTARHLKRPK